LNRQTFENRLVRQTEPHQNEKGENAPDMSARTKNSYAVAAIAFANWRAEPTVGQAAMRRRKIEMTMNVYTDPKLLDLAGALKALPNLPLNDQTPNNSGKLTDTGRSVVAPTVAPTRCNGGQSKSNLHKSANDYEHERDSRRFDVSRDGVKTRNPLTKAVNGCREMGATGLEPVTPSVSSDT
jgi:hypothetical protein